MDDVNQVEEVPAVPPPAPPRFVGDNRSEVVSLDFPLEYDGKVYSTVTVRRMTGEEIRQFLDDLLDNDGGRVRFPMFDAPDAVMNALDPDDADKVDEVVERFLPRRLRPAARQSPASGATTSPSSEAS